MSDLEEQQSGISRRTVAMAAAWSIPAIALAVPTPAYAASPGIITLSGDGCKLPGNSNDVYKGYAFAAVISNTTPAPITITITDMTLNGDDLGNVAVVNLSPCQNLGNPFTVPANTTLTRVALVTENAANSSNGTLAVTFTVNGGGTQVVTVTADAAPPIQGGSCKAFTAAERTCINNVAGA